MSPPIASTPITAGNCREDARFTDEVGATLGWRWTALDSVGLYVPGGTASYPSSVLMNAVPARVAGVARIAMVTPASGGAINPLTLAAAKRAGVTEIYRVGGAQAIAALAYGTETIVPVDKIVGPGNAYVAAAKREVFGQVGIDSVAGPSEILVVADAANNPDWIAADLLSQAEHDTSSQSILITDDAGFADRVDEAVTRALAFAAAQGRSRAQAGASTARSSSWKLDGRRARSSTGSRRNISSLPSPIPKRCWAKCAMRARSSSAATRRKPWATTSPDPITCCPPRARRGSRRAFRCSIS